LIATAWFYEGDIPLRKHCSFCALDALAVRAEVRVHGRQLPEDSQGDCQFYRCLCGERERVSASDTLNAFQQWLCVGLFCGRSTLSTCILALLDVYMAY
jgi:hypothetical protein